jgi:hypothetical protein
MDDISWLLFGKEQPPDNIRSTVRAAQAVRFYLDQFSGAGQRSSSDDFQKTVAVPGPAVYKMGK